MGNHPFYLRILNYGNGKTYKNDRVIERNKVDYENNKEIWKIRGWSLALDDKPKPKEDNTTKRPDNNRRKAKGYKDNN